MKKGLNFLLLFYCFLFITPANAGWPEDGWFATSDLNLSHKAVPLSFNEIHHKLAETEKDISRMLPPSHTANIVLANITLVSEGQLKSYPIAGPDTRPYVFESGWESSFSEDPALNLVESVINKYAPPQRKGEMSSESKVGLLRGCEETIKRSTHFHEHIKPYYYFSPDQTSVESILLHIEPVFHGVKREEAGFKVFEDFTHNKGVYEKAKNALEREKERACKELLDLSQLLTPSELNDSALKNIESKAQNHRKVISSKHREVSNIGAKIIATYWHSEQKLLDYIRQHTDSLLSTINGSPDAIILSIHSRFDICQVCSHSFVRSYTHPMGILTRFKESVCSRLDISPETFPFFVISSFREERTGFDYKKEKKIPLKELKDLESFYPAFPTLHIS